MPRKISAVPYVNDKVIDDEITEITMGDITKVEMKEYSKNQRICVFNTVDGGTYVLPFKAEHYKNIFKLYDFFECADRGIILNVKNIDHFDDRMGMAYFDREKKLGVSIVESRWKVIYRKWQQFKCLFTSKAQ